MDRARCCRSRLDRGCCGAAPAAAPARSRCCRGEPGLCRCRGRQGSGAFPEQALDRGWELVGRGDCPSRPRDPSGPAAPSAPPPRAAPPGGPGAGLRARRPLAGPERGCERGAPWRARSGAASAAPPGGPGAGLRARRPLAGPERGCERGGPRGAPGPAPAGLRSPLSPATPKATVHRAGPGPRARTSGALARRVPAERAGLHRHGPEEPLRAGRCRSCSDCAGCGTGPCLGSVLLGPLTRHLPGHPIS
ncbi:uncharacterized protein LOC141729411 [Zonotrichia albicollis]|uniref:uncharacterized protein LOC141729411 n=1 Tax=Zonotrichia albicollis TaxID=44394 RepID=UPI003D810172